MSQHAGRAGRRGLQLLSINHLPIQNIRQAQSIIRPAFYTGSSARRSILPSVSAPPRTDEEKLHHASTAFAQATPFRWPRSPAPTPLQLGLSTPLHSHARVSGGISTFVWNSSSQRRWQSDKKTQIRQTDPEKSEQSLEESSERAKQHLAAASSPASSSSSSGSRGHLLDRLPHLHRPTKEELLAAASGFWHRLQIRFKWFSIRSVRPFNSEEIFALVSWIFWGHVLWIVIGTTTFVSLGILALNTVFAQETLAEWVGAYLTRSIGVKIVFESAIVPRWRDGVICFQNVFLSRHPVKNKKERSVTKGSSSTAMTAAQAEKERATRIAETGSDLEDDGNYSQFDLTIERVEVSLSFVKWFNGKGLLRDVEVRGVRGVLDRTFVQPSTGEEDPKSYRHEHSIGDIEIDNFRMEDVLLTVYQPNGFRPFQVSVFNCELPRLRKQWLFYDFLCANYMSGSFDDSLFTIHPRQAHGTNGTDLNHNAEDEAWQWKKHSRLRIDGLKIDHLNRGVEGPFSWIYEGNVDIVADIMVPNDADGSIAKVMSDFYDRMEATVTNAQAQQSHGDSQNTQERSTTIENRSESWNMFHRPRPAAEQESNDDRFLIFDIQIHLNDVRASVPIFTRDLSYGGNALVRPVVAYINSHSHRDANFIPISCRIVKRLSEFDGSWSVFDCGLLDDLSQETYEAFVRDIMDRKQRRRRIKKVGLWAAQVAAQALFIGLAGQLA